MSLVDGEERAAIPSISWKSVVNEEATDCESDSGPDTPSPASSDDTVPSSPPVSFQMTPLVEQASTETTPEPAPPPPPPPPPISFTMGAPGSAPDAELLPAEPAAGTAPSAPVVEPVSLSVPQVAAATPSVTVPMPAPQPDPQPVEFAPLADLTPTESATTVAPAPPAETTSTIVSEPIAAVAQSSEPSWAGPPVASEPAAHNDATTPEQFEPAGPAPAPQPDQSAAPSLPQTRVAPAVPQLSSAYTDATPSQSAAPVKKDRTTAIARLGFFLLFVAAVISAVVIFGRPYLFPEEWEDNALPFAESIETTRGREFIEPIRLIGQDNPAHRDLVAEQLFGDAQANMPTWRSLGLAGHDSTDDASLRDLTSLQSPVLYSTSDGQVYYDQTFNQAHRDQLIMRSMTAAALDQELGFTATAADRGLDATALIDAHVLQQSAYVAQLASTTPVSVPEPDVAALAFLPPVLDYRLTAPLVLSDVLQPVNDLAAPNPLEGIGSDGPTMARDTVLEVMPVTPGATGDTPVGETVAMDRGFWYLVFAGHVDATTAYEMSNTIEQAGLQTVRSADGRTCTVSTFGTANGADGERLSLTLMAWMENTATELDASVDTLSSTSVRMRSCDPEGPYTSNARFGIARELIGWRATEEAVVSSLTAQGATPAAITAALAQIVDEPSVQNLVALPAGTAPSEVAALARDAAANVVAASGG